MLTAFPVSRAFVREYSLCYSPAYSATSRKVRNKSALVFFFVSLFSSTFALWPHRHLFASGLYYMVCGWCLEWPVVRERFTHVRDKLKSHHPRGFSPITWRSWHTRVGISLSVKRVKSGPDVSRAQKRRQYPGGGSREMRTTTRLRPTTREQCESRRRTRDTFHARDDSVVENTEGWVGETQDRRKWERDRGSHRAPFNLDKSFRLA